MSMAEQARARGWRPAMSLLAVAVLGAWLLALAALGRWLLGITLHGWLVWGLYAAMWASAALLVLVALGACAIIRSGGRP